MTVIVQSGQTHTVRVPAPTAVATVRVATQPLTSVDARTVTALAAAAPRVTNVTSTGVQGSPGAPGGTSQARVAASALGGHRLVRSTSAAAVDYATATNASHGDDTLGMTLGAADEGQLVNVQRSGPVSFNGWTWTPGEPVFLGANGLPTQTPLDLVDGATFIQVVGHAEDATTLYLAIEPPIYFED